MSINKLVCLSSLLIALCTELLTPTLCVAGESTDFDDKLARVVQRFERKKQCARSCVFKEFNKAETTIRRNRNLPDATRTDCLQRIQDYRATFEQTQRFPDIPESLPMELTYYQKLDKAFAPVRKLIDAELRNANRHGHDLYAQQLVQTRQTLMADALGFSPLATEQIFRGTIHTADGTSIPYELRIDNADAGGLFGGIVDQNRGVAGHPRYRVSGETDGIQIRCTMSENLRSHFSVVRIEGVIAGDRLVAKVTQQRKGRPVRNHLVLLRR